MKESRITTKLNLYATYYNFQLKHLNVMSLTLSFWLCSIFSVLHFPVLNAYFILSLFITLCSIAFSLCKNCSWWSTTAHLTIKFQLVTVKQLRTHWHLLLYSSHNFWNVSQLNAALSESSWSYLNFIPLFVSLLIVKYFFVLAYFIFFFSIYKFCAFMQFLKWLILPLTNCFCWLKYY